MTHSDHTATPHLAEDTGNSLDLRPVFKLAWRTLPYLRRILRELRVLGAILFPLGVLAIPLSMLIADLFFNRMLVGSPLTAFEAEILGLDPAYYVDVAKLGVAERTVLRSRLVWTMAGLALASTPLTIWIAYRLLRVRQRINQFLRVEMVENMQAQSMRFHADTAVGETIYRTYQDSAVVTGLMAMLLRPIGPIIRISTGILIAFLFDWRLPLALIATYVALYALSATTTQRLRRGFRRSREHHAALLSRIQETMAGIKVIKAFGAEPTYQDRFEESSRAAFAAAREGRGLLALVGILSFTVAALLPTVFAYYAALLARDGSPLAAGAALAFLGFAVWNLGSFTDATGRVGAWAGAARNLVQMWATAQDMGVGMERAFGEVDRKAEVRDAETARDMTEFRDAVEFRNVSFAYQTDVEVLRNVDLVARRGTVTAIVGPTGSGKSTMVALLLRLFDPTRGAITIDGTDLRHVRLKSLRSHVAVALQESLLFATSIRDNIAYAAPGTDDASVRRAAEIACADDFIRQQENGYDQLLGERGARLSAGQRQRLSIARAIFKNAPILVLDEPTAALDAETELRVMQNLTEWGRDKAIFIITHRLSTIRCADQIAYLEDGQVVELGAPSELAARDGGAYRRFAELESGIHDDVAGAR